jgi:hypothetical protein
MTKYYYYYYFARHGHDNERLTLRNIHKLKLFSKTVQRRLFYFELRVKTGVDPVISGLIVCNVYRMLLECFLRQDETS